MEHCSLQADVLQGSNKIEILPNFTAHWLWVGCETTLEFSSISATISLLQAFGSSKSIGVIL
jgi:hypothetical protein